MFFKYYDIQVVQILDIRYLIKNKAEEELPPTESLRDNVKRKALFLFCKGQKAHCTFLQETHSCDADATWWSNQWGEKILFSHGSNRSGGVAICFNRCPGKIVASKAEEQGHWMAIVLNVE